MEGLLDIERRYERRTFGHYALIWDHIDQARQREPQLDRQGVRDRGQDRHLEEGRRSPQREAQASPSDQLTALAKRRDLIAIRETDGAVGRRILRHRCQAISGERACNREGPRGGSGLATNALPHPPRPHQIGGMCIEVSADDGTRILLDLGMPLYDAERDDYPFGMHAAADSGAAREGRPAPPSPVSTPTTPTAPGFAAIIVTHSHLDHYGLAHHAHPAHPRVRQPRHAGDPRGQPHLPRRRRRSRPTCRPLPDDEALRIGSAHGHRHPCRPLGAPTHGPCWSKPTARSSSTPATCGRTAAPASASRSCSPTRACSGADWLLFEGTTLGAGGDGHGLRSEQEVEDELVALAQAGARQARRRRRVGPEPRPPGVLLSGRRGARAGSWSSTPTRRSC